MLRYWLNRELTFATEPLRCLGLMVKPFGISTANGQTLENVSRLENEILEILGHNPSTLNSMLVIASLSCRQPLYTQT